MRVLCLFVVLIGLISPAYAGPYDDAQAADVAAHAAQGNAYTQFDYADCAYQESTQRRFEAVALLDVEPAGPDQNTAYNIFDNGETRRAEGIALMAMAGAKVTSGVQKIEEGNVLFSQAMQLAEDGYQVQANTTFEQAQIKYEGAKLDFDFASTYYNGGEAKLIQATGYYVQVIQFLE